MTLAPKGVHDFVQGWVAARGIAEHNVDFEKSELVRSISERAWLNVFE